MNEEGSQVIDWWPRNGLLISLSYISVPGFIWSRVLFISFEPYFFMVLYDVNHVLGEVNVIYLFLLIRLVSTISDASRSTKPNNDSISEAVR